MPTYQYVCTACGEDLEAVQSFSEASLTECPTCQGQLRKVFSAVGVVFKGSGFYKTDSRAAPTSSGSADGKGGDTGKGSDGKGGDTGKGSDGKGGDTGKGSESGSAPKKADAPVSSSNGSSGNGSSGNGSSSAGAKSAAPVAKSA